MQLKTARRLLISVAMIVSSASMTLFAAEPIQYSDETLENGLRVIYAPLHQAPVVHMRVLYHVGSRDERPDRQGFAHMFEHMMFRGSAHVKPQEHMKLVGIVGGDSNAFTSFDQTVYVNTFPSAHLEMVMYLEADRMASFQVSPEIYQTERKVVSEEWRMGRNRPYGTMYEDFLAAAFSTHPYRWTPIGKMEHLRAAGADELQAFFNRYYVPNNAVLVIAGDIDPAKAQALVKRYFGWIPRGPDVVRHIPAEPDQTAARNVTLKQRVPLARVVVGYKLPKYGWDGQEAMDLLATILGQGRSSQLDQRLVNNAQPLCVAVGAGAMQLEDAGMLLLHATVLRGGDPAKVEAVMRDAIAEVATNGVTAEELEKARTQARVSLIRERETATNIAQQLGEAALLTGDPGYANTVLDRIEAVTPTQLQGLASRWLQPSRATTLTIAPDPQAPRESDDVESATTAAATRPAPATLATSAPVAISATVATSATSAPAAATTQPRTIRFPQGYPQTPPMAEAPVTPQFQKGIESLTHGVRTIVMRDNRLPLISFSLTMRRGSDSDPAGKEGLADLTADLVRRGAGAMTYSQLNEDLESRAIDIELSASGDTTRLTGSCPTEQLDTAIERARMILREPAFPADELARLREQTISQLRLAMEDAQTVAERELDHRLFGDTPPGRSATPQSVESISMEDVKGFYQTMYRPDEAILVLAGDLTLERGQELAGQLLDGWENRPAPKPQYEFPAPPSRRIVLIDRPQGKQATIRMGVRAYSLASDDKFAGSLAGQILTAGIDSRLGRYVRAEKGLAYGVHGVFQPNRRTGAFVAGTDTALGSTEAAVRAILKVLNDVRDHNVTDTELTDAKLRVSGSMVMSMQTIAQQARFRVDGILNGYPIDYYDRYPQRITGITADDVREVMRKYFLESSLTIIVAAPAEAVKDQLSALGEVEVIPMPSAAKSPATAASAWNGRPSR